MTFGLQPGFGFNEPSVIVATQVIIIGTGDGLFVYNGSPALGTLAIAITSQAGADKYGNSYNAGITVDGLPMLVYSGTPAFGNLVVSIAPAAGTDEFGNPYPEGFGLSQGAIPGGLINAGTVGTAQITAGAITTALIAAGAVVAASIADGAITTAQIAAAAGILGTQLADATIGTAQIEDDAITGALIADGAVSTSQIADDSITNALMTDAAIETVNIADGAVTSEQIAAAAGILGSQLAADAGITASQVSFTAAEIGGVQVTLSATEPVSPHTGDLWYDTAAGNSLYEYNGTEWVAYQYGTSAIADSAITTALINTGAVTASQIADGTITATQIAADAAILGTQLADGTVTATQLESGAALANIGSGNITQDYLSGTITARTLGGITTTISGSEPASPNTGDIWIDSANGYQLNQWSGSAWVAITWTATDVIEAESVTAALIAANTITAGQIAAGTITATQIAAATITGALIAAGTITGSLIEAGTITSSLIAANAITTGLLAAGAVTAEQLAAGIVYAGIVDGTTIEGATLIATSSVDGSQITVATETGDFATIMFASGASGEVTAANLISQIVGSGESQTSLLSMFGPASSGDGRQVAISLSSATVSGEVLASGTLFFNTLAALAWGETGVNVQTGDGSIYDVARLTAVSPGQTIDSTSAVAVANLSFPNLAVNTTYRIHGEIYYTPNQSAGTGTFSFATTTGFTTFLLKCLEAAAPINTTGTAVSWGNGVIINTRTGTFVTSTFGTASRVLMIDGILITDSGDDDANSFELEAKCTASASDSFDILAGSWLELLPVIQTT